MQVEVSTDENGNPWRLNDRGQEKRVVRTLDFWRYGGRWWVFEPPRDYFLLELEGGKVVEVYRAGEHWTLSRVTD